MDQLGAYAWAAVKWAALALGGLWLLVTLSDMSPSEFRLALVAVAAVVSATTLWAILKKLEAIEKLMRDRR